MANQPGNGRNEDNRWRSDDDAMHSRNRDDEERIYQGRMRDDERFMQRERERSGATWDDRSHHGWDRDDDRSVGWRSIDRGGMGQSGYGAGRPTSDRSFQSSNPSYPPSWDDRARERGVDERFAVGRGMSGQPYQRGPSSWGNEMGHSGRDPNEDMGYGGGGGMQGGGWQRHDQRLGYGRSTQQGQNMYNNTAYGPGYFDPHRSEPRYGRDFDEHHESLGQRIKDWFTGHRGKGPMGYQRSDERIRETVCEALSDDDRVDATNIEVTVKSGEVTLSGTVEDRRTKRMAEDCVEHLPGVKDVQNNIRVVSSDRRIDTPSTTGNGSDKRHRA